MKEGLDAFKSGQVALQMNWFAFFPGLYKDEKVGGAHIGFFVNPPAKERGSQLGGQGMSVVSYSPNKAEALAYIKWFASPDVQKKWWSLGGYSAHKAVLNDPRFAATAPFPADFLPPMGAVVAVVGTSLLPPLWAVRLLVLEYRANRPNEPLFSVGIDHFQSSLSDPDIWAAMQATAHFVVWTIVLQTLLGFALAYLIDRKFRGHALWTTIILIPMMLSPAVVGNFWRFLYQPQIGLFNYLVAFVSGVPPSSFEMIGSVKLAPWAIILVDTWMWTPYVALIVLAGLRSIPDYIYEAAEVDRASKWRRSRSSAKLSRSGGPVFRRPSPSFFSSPCLASPTSMSRR